MAKNEIAAVGTPVETFNLVKGKKGKKGKAAKKGKKPQSNGKKGKKPQSNGYATKDRVAKLPGLLSGTGKGTPGCPAFGEVKKKTPSFVEIGETAVGGTKATLWPGTDRAIQYTGLLRWCGANGWHWKRAGGLLANMGIGSRENTIRSQVFAGSRGKPGDTKYPAPFRGPIPKLSKAEIAQISKYDPGE